MIPEAAVEAAARALSIHTMVDDSPENEKFREAVRLEARRALEAAAPHMLADAWESGWANARGNYTALHTGQDIPEWVTLRNPYGSQDDQS